MSFEAGNKADGKHYWLTPPWLSKALGFEFSFNFDPCPFPKPDDFDGLHTEWGSCSYVNPPFGSYTDKTDGKKKGPTAWARKCIEQHKKGKTVVMVYPIDKWVLMMLQAGAEVRNLGDVKWHSTENNEPGPGTGRHVACFILKPPLPNASPMPGPGKVCEECGGSGESIHKAAGIKFHNPCPRCAVWQDAQEHGDQIEP